ncbi:hypothetical protein Sgleb_32210 [Streptomyces glebosus]|uniref:Uncharacterized protein n=1 Tax=Streptomyces glebosus TaxID=249580 RepID=A0A640SWE2_9ACTN|nr:hypothetical protein Sgleb_32210 [Streptomyces glebosus]
MRNLPESRHAPKLRVFHKDRLYAVSHGKGENAPRGALLFWRRANGIKRSTTIRTPPPGWQMTVWPGPPLPWTKLPAPPGTPHASSS